MVVYQAKLIAFQVPADLCFLPGRDSRLRRPLGIASDWELFMQFVGESHSIARLILEKLSNALGLEGVSLWWHSIGQVQLSKTQLGPHFSDYLRSVHPNHFRIKTTFI